MCLAPMGVLRGVRPHFQAGGVNVKSGLLLYAKPDITAPGVNIRIPGNKEKTVTGHLLQHLWLQVLLQC